MVARCWGCDCVPPTWKQREQDAGDRKGPPHIHPTALAPTEFDGLFLAYLCTTQPWCSYTCPRTGAPGRPQGSSPHSTPPTPLLWLVVVFLYMPSYKTVFPIPGSLIPVFSRQKDCMSLQIEKHVVYKFVQIALDSVQNMCYTCAWP
jgi:hypothetical protein